MGKVAKVTISVPNAMLEAVEREREAKGETRSAFFVRAVEDYLRRERERQADEEYIRGYQEMPETEEERAWAEYGLTMLARITAEDRWEE
jgi:metal-responsive CopG/Arc/MetJ family transcriptional regulator